MPDGNPDVFTLEAFAPVRNRVSLFAIPLAGPLGFGHQLVGRPGSSRDPALLPLIGFVRAPMLPSQQGGGRARPERPVRLMLEPPEPRQRVVEYAKGWFVQNGPRCSTSRNWE